MAESLNGMLPNAALVIWMNTALMLVIAAAAFLIIRMSRKKRS